MLVFEIKRGSYIIVLHHSYLIGDTCTCMWAVKFRCGQVQTELHLSRKVTGISRTAGSWVVYTLTNKKSKTSASISTNTTNQP